MTAWALYLLAVSLLLAGAARAAESALALYRLPVRWVWGLALAASLATPLLFGLAAPPVHTGPSPDALSTLSLAELPIGTVEAASPGLLDRLAPPAAVDRAVGVVWGISACVALLVLALWFLAIAVAPYRWPRRRVDDEDVRIAPAAGPAVFGLLRPSIVVPEWLLGCPSEVRRLALLHEREHVSARDPALLAMGAMLTALTPWNPVSWWMLVRLRAAVELDCDRRVLRRGASVHAYGAMLLGIAGRTASPHLAVALVEPAVLLERRIRAMTNGNVKRRIVRGIACAGLCAAAVLVACTMDGPTEPSPAEEAAALAAPAEASPETETATGRYFEALDRMGRVVALLREELRDGGRAGNATFEVLIPTRAEAELEAVESKTRAVVREILEAQTIARGEVGEVEKSHVDRERVLEAARGALEKVHVDVGEIDEIRGVELRAVEVSELPAKKTRIRLRPARTLEPDAPLVFIDGVKATEAEMEALVPGGIDRIEVMKGAAAARLYGEAAGKGVIRIMTKK